MIGSTTLIGALGLLAVIAAPAPNEPSEPTEQVEPAAPDEPAAPVGPVESGEQAAPLEPAEKDKRAEKDKPSAEVTGRVMGGWRYDTDRPTEDQGGGGFDAAHRFFLQQARLKLKARLNPHVSATISADFSDAIGNNEAIPYLRSAFANLRLHDLIQLRAGRFKRPMSALENRSAGRIQFRGRGLTNSFIIEDLEWGDRAIGAMLWGKTTRKFARWGLAVTNASQAPVGQPSRKGVDVMGRVAISPVKAFTIGVNGGYKRIERADLSNADVFAGGGDMRLKIAGFYVAAETLIGQDHRIASDPLALGALGYASYDIKLPREFVLQPVIFGEWIDANLSERTNEAMRLLGGVNLLWRKNIRLMPQFEVVRAYDDIVDGIPNPFESGETLWIMLSVEGP